MTHRSDPPSDRPASGRLRAFLEHERESGTHKAVETLRRRPHARDQASRKASEYARIERGRET